LRNPPERAPDPGIGGELQAVERRLDAVLDRPGVSAVERLVQRMHALELARGGGGVIVEHELPGFAHARGHRLEHGLPGLERRLLRDRRDLDAGRDPHLAVVGTRGALEDAQQARLAGAVAADEADVLARLDYEVGVVEEGNVAKGEGSFGELEERHRPRIYPAARRLGTQQSQATAG
jgi:hypothetical protein